MAFIFMLSFMLLSELKVKTQFEFFSFLAGRHIKIKLSRFLGLVKILNLYS